MTPPFDPFLLRPHAASLAAGAGGFDRLIGIGLALCLALLLAGISLPLVTVARFFILEEQFSILTAIALLLEESEYLVALAVLMFSVVFPFLKLAVAWALWRYTPAGGPRLVAALKRLDLLGKWSMLDVLVAALFIFSVKASAVADARTEPGLYFFCASVVLAILVTARIKHAAYGALQASETDQNRK